MKRWQVIGTAMVTVELFVEAETKAAAACAAEIADYNEWKPDDEDGAVAIFDVLEVEE